MEKRSQKPYLTDKYLLIAQDLWQAHYLILLKILLKEKKCKKKKKMQINKTKTNKKYTSRYMLKMSKKELLIYLYAFFKSI